MTIRTFWIIFIKILGLWMVFGSITIIPQVFSSIYMFSQGDDGPEIILMTLLVLFIAALFFITLRLFILKPLWLIDKLHLTKDFTEEKIDLNISQTTVLRIALIVIGGFMFIESVPELCRLIFTTLQEKVLFGESHDTGWIIFHAIKTICAYLLMTNSSAVSAYINKKTEQQASEPTA